MAKHVILLGAGASHTSGYPLANGLRLLMSSVSHLEEAITRYEAKHNLKERPIATEAMAFVETNRKAIDLFRHGGFATIDEFCKLASGRFQNDINRLKILIRAVLGTFNPEEQFEKSEYYGLVQSLFKEDLVSLRDDVAILTYNYDPYLEYLLSRAIEHRSQIGPNHKDQTSLLNSVTSGFYMPDDQGWFNNKGFCVLKLHGSICFPNETFGFDTLFRASAKERGGILFTKKGHETIPPMLFPWEIIGANGIANKDTFVLRNSLFSNRGILYSLFCNIWDRARREVQEAEKISFVGLSIHPFMSGGLKYLLSGKTGRVEICVCNPDNSPWIRGQHDSYWQNKPHTSAHAVHRAQKLHAPGIDRVGMLNGSLTTDQFTLVNNFEAFVKTQMK